MMVYVYFLVCILFNESTSGVDQAHYYRVEQGSWDVARARSFCHAKGHYSKDGFTLYTIVDRKPKDECENLFI